MTTATKTTRPIGKPCCSEQLLALRDGLEILGGKWKLLILLYLFNTRNDSNHFKKIQRDVAGISAKMLTKELRDLETNLLVTRNVQDDPIRVVYTLSEHGRTTIKLTRDLMRWGLNHRQKVKENF